MTWEGACIVICFFNLLKKSKGIQRVQNRLTEGREKGVRVRKAAGLFREKGGQRMRHLKHPTGNMKMEDFKWVAEMKKGRSLYNEAWSFAELGSRYPGLLVAPNTVSSYDVLSPWARQTVPLPWLLPTHPTKSYYGSPACGGLLRPCPLL